MGWSATYTRNVIQQLVQRFPLIDESPKIFSNWLKIVSSHQIVGKRTHDARIVAVMHSAKVQHILTLNPKDFAGIDNVLVVHPKDVLSVS